MSVAYEPSNNMGAARRKSAKDWVDSREGAREKSEEKSDIFGDNILSSLTNGGGVDIKKNIDMSADFSESDEEAKKTKKFADDAIKTFDDLFNESVGDKEIGNKIVFNKDADDESDEASRNIATVEDLLMGSDND